MADREKPPNPQAEQEAAEFGDQIAITWRGIYSGCRRQHFTHRESMDLLKTWIIAQSQAAAQRDDGDDDESEDWP